MNKKVIIRILTIIGAVVIYAALCVLAFVDFDSFKKRYYTVNYESGIGGRIVGNVSQTVQEGKEGETVVAVPDKGYRFLRWTDTCSPNPTRKEAEVFKNLKSQAKFVKISDVKYKILLVYVTEVQATFPDANGNEIVADYKMTEEDLAVCRMTTELFDICLNEIFNGLVTFEIDEYYTTEIMREENFNYVINNDGDVDYSLYAEDIPEVENMLNNYGSYITTVPLNKNIANKLTVGAGEAGYKSGTVRYECIIPSNLHRGDTINSPGIIDDYSCNQWLGIIETYVHEFIHTVEQGIRALLHYPYHMVLSQYSAEYSGYDPNRYTFTIDKLYLLNKAEYNGKTAGIPFPVWTNEIYEVHYKANDESIGTVGGNAGTDLRVAKGYDGEEVEAIAWSGYRFVGWSDGVETAKRVDKNIQANMEVTAIFEPMEFTIKYIATKGGRIEGKTEQTTLGKKPFETVTAVADEGYRFVGWSDRPELDSRFTTRTDRVHAGNVEEFERNNNKLVITAIFEKI